MVRVIMGNTPLESMSLDQVNGMNADEVIKAYGKDNSCFLSVGRRLDGKQPLSELCLHDRSTIRIVQESVEMTPTLPHDFENKLKTVYENMKKVLGSNNRTFMISDYMTDTDKMDGIRKKFPEMYSNSHVYMILNDFYTLQAFFSECTPEKATLIRSHPYMLEAVISLVQTAMGKHREMMSRPRVAAPPVGPPPAPLFSPEAIAAALRTAMATNARGGESGTVPAPVPPPQPVQNLREQYRTQLIQLREFGFVDDEMNMHVLVESNGSIDAAIELLIAMRESMEH